MIKELLFFEPIFKNRIWGGTALKDVFGYNIPDEKTGECWAISAHENGSSLVKNGIYTGRSLKDLWEKETHLFGYYNDSNDLTATKFPLLVKILDARENLSVQVHPSDQYANKYENGELGKTECWYILDCQADADIVFGHTAKTKDQAISMINQSQWDQFLIRKKIKPGDFFYVSEGTVHAICKGTLVLEVQQSSDITYRMYDYNRLDDSGNLRELHIEKSLDVITIPDLTEPDRQVNQVIVGDCTITTYVSNDFFTVEKYNINGGFSMRQNQKEYRLVSVIEGQGTVDQIEIKKGDHFLMPYGYEKIELVGNMEMIVAYK